MSFRCFPAAMMGAVAAIQLLVVAPAAAEDIETLELSVQIENAIALMQQENWGEALKYCEASVKTYGQGAMEAYGARFGGVYFRKGVCELKLKKWDAAMKSFETCYKEFPNKEGVSPDLGNPFQKTCLLQWAEAAIGAEDWKLALDLYEKFLKERDRERDKFNRGTLYISMAVCHYNLGDLAKGNENLEIAITNKDRFGVPSASILGAFRYMITAAIEGEKEQALLDFLAKNRGEIIADPFEMYPFAGMYIKLAKEAIDKEMFRAAFEIYQLIPVPEAAINEARAKLVAIGPLRQLRKPGGALVKEQLEKGIAQIESAEKNGQSLEIVKLAASAFLHEQFGNVRGAYAAYRLLEQYYPMAQNREDNLFNLARVSFMVSEGRESLRDAQLFLSTFPDSKNAPLIRRLTLSSLFAERKYEECIENALELIKTLPKGSDQHDLCLHVLGGSYFYTGQYEVAQKYLDQHVADYPNSDSAVAAAYFQASNKFRLNQYAEAGPLLDSFIKKYPDAAGNPFLPYAYYDRATVFFVEDKNEDALKMTDELIANFSDSNIVDQAHNLRGNILQSMDRPIDAEGAYKQGLRISERLGHQMVSGAAIYNLIDLLVKETKGKPEGPRLEEGIGYVDAFWGKYAEGSPYSRVIAVSQIPILEAAGRLDEAIERLRNVISEMSEDPEAADLEEKLDAYTEAYLKKYSVEQLKEHYLNFPGVKPTARAARALLQIQVISAYETLAKKSKDPAEKAAIEAKIKASFARLKSDFDVKDLPSSTLTKVGNYLRLKTATPREALPFYDEVIQRGDKTGIHGALMGRADIYGDSGNAADIDKALADLERVSKETEKPKEKEFSLFRTVELLVAKGAFEAASAKAKIYLDDANYQKSRNAPAVGLLMARSFEGRKMIDDAIAMYAKTWAQFAGNIGVSAPAMKRYMELLWERNKTAPDPKTFGDRQGAYVAAANYVKNTSGLQDRMQPSELEAWKEVEALMKQYEANPNIKTLEQLEKEQKEKKPR